MTRMHRLLCSALAGVAIAALSGPQPARAQTGAAAGTGTGAGVPPPPSVPTQTRDYFLNVISNDPAVKGQAVRIYVHERATPQVIRTVSGNPVVLFVHGAIMPAEVAFDLPFADYSWMTYLASAGFDVFSVDMLGYGRSTRPAQMADRCNLAKVQQLSVGVSCPQSYPGALTNIDSDWQDIDAAVDFIRRVRHANQINLIAWSQGGPRAGGWAARHPEEVARIVLLAPLYTRAASPTQPPLPVPGPAFRLTDHEAFMATWNRQAPCARQYDPAVAQAVWSAMLRSDPIGASWMPPVMRAPISSWNWGWTAARVRAMKMPVLMVSGVNDKQVDPQRVRDLYEDLGSDQKLLVSLACSSHNAMWERNHLMLFQASLEWLEKGTVDGQRSGMLALGQ